MISKIFMAAAATMLVAAPVAAAPINPAASLSVSKSVRSGSSTAGKSELAGRSGGFIVAILAVVAVGFGIYAVADNNDNADSN